METLLALLVIYFLPTIVALARSRTNTGSIFIVNFFLGLTLVGWVVALAWSFSHDDHKTDERGKTYLGPAPTKNPDDGWMI